MEAQQHDGALHNMITLFIISLAVTGYQIFCRIYITIGYVLLLTWVGTVLVLDVIYGDISHYTEWSGADKFNLILCVDVTDWYNSLYPLITLITRHSPHLCRSCLWLDEYSYCTDTSSIHVIPEKLWWMSRSTLTYTFTLSHTDSAWIMYIIFMHYIMSHYKIYWNFKLACNSEGSPLLYCLVRLALQCPIRHYNSSMCFITLVPLYKTARRRANPKFNKKGEK